MVQSENRKKWGQHFLSDPQVISQIIDLISPGTDDLMVEIGPGKGALTQHLARRVGHLHAIEIDPELVEQLNARSNPDSITIHHCNALGFPYRTLASNDKKLRIVGNLPYSISTALLIRLLDYSDCIEDLCFMVQREVAERVSAECGSRHYGRLTVTMGAVMDAETVFDVRPDAFSPPPEVQSAVIYMRPNSGLESELSATFSAVVRTAFSARRKTLRNALASVVDACELQRCGIDAGARAQNLSVNDYLKLAKYLSKRASESDNLN